MIVAVGLLTLGLALIAAAVKGVSLVDLFAGKAGSPFTPVSGGGTATTSTDTTNGTSPQVGSTKFKGPHAANLQGALNTAEGTFHLHLASGCRSPAENAAVGGSPTSLHVQCRAFDAAGKATDMMAFARWAHALNWVDEVFYDPAGWSAPGYDHSDHVHVGA
ncbi:MAG TPA: D-Ala-D-Ala carboxypeptidase family metallohydrolase [Candidatus Acidoferrum sp.]|nr:D-Ala-D-Ala carboxypeptidase family metallohydrolase [Candidatus Acidoferrum sp.]